MPFYSILFQKLFPPKVFYYHVTDLLLLFLNAFKSPIRLNKNININSCTAHKHRLSDPQ